MSSKLVQRQQMYTSASSSIVPRQKAFIILSITSLNVVGNKKILITYDIIAWRTDLIITSLPALERKLLLHELILCQTCFAIVSYEFQCWF